MWFTTGKAAVKYARESLEKGRGYKVEVYAPEDVPFKTFLVPGNSVKPAASPVFRDEIHRRKR
jgi:hypothetical protein